MRALYVFLFCLLLPFAEIKADAGPAAGQLIQYSLVKSFPREELQAFFKLHKIPKAVLPVKQGLNVYEVIYTTLYADSSLVKASGLLYVPMDRHIPLSRLIYNHGTEICRDRSCSFTGEQSICLSFATDDYVVMTPDYVGMGQGDRNQLYLNAFTEARASTDMLQACEPLLALLNVKLNHHLFVTGYSQGGHAAMATTRMLQQNYAGEYTVTASAPMSGPYDIENTVYEGRNNPYDYPGFLMLLLRSYFESEGKLDELHTALKAPYDTLIPPLVDGNYPIDEVDKLLPDTIFLAVNDSFYNEFVNNPNCGFRTYLRKNNVYDWKPDMHMQLCYCNGDEEVNYKNSITAYETMKRNGSKKVELWRAGKKFGHVNCALFAVVYTKMYFDGFRHGHPGHHGPVFKRLLLEIGKMVVPAR